MRRTSATIVPVVVALAGTLAAAAGVLSVTGRPSAASERTPPSDVPTCGEAPTVLSGTATPEQAKSYEFVPFRVPEGTARIEIGYTWTPNDAGVVDLGVWDQHGTSGPEAFRTWAGSRQGRIDTGTAPLVIAADRNERTVVARPVEPGIWHVELGLAAVEAPLEWRVEVRCVPGPAPTPLPSDPVDPNVVIRDEPGWYAGDFHLHGYHSSPDGPDPDDMVAKAVAAGLDIIPVTEYVTPAHWDRLGTTQRTHPDVLIWPGREVISYFGHMIVLSETPGEVEYRVGFTPPEADRPITPADIQQGAAADGGLVSLAHPTIFPPDTFGSACRGCFFERLDELDLERLTALEVVTEGSVAELGGTEVPNPFVRTAVELWEGFLRDGHRITAVSGSDDKSGDSYGSTSTMVYAEQLSRPAVDRAIRQGHAYVRGVGNESPTMDLRATADDGSTGIFGDTLVTDRAEIAITVRGGEGQVLSVRRNGTEVERLPITTPEFSHTVTASRTDDEGPLGTFWGAEVLDTTRFPGTDVPTVIANPVFLADRPAADVTSPTFTPTGSLRPVAESTSSPGEDSSTGSSWPFAGLAVIAALVTAGSVALVARRRSR
ncbi:MAG: CehA/McbA family metallohydrolase [Microthrixaceae bacterium]